MMPEPPCFSLQSIHSDSGSGSAGSFFILKATLSSPLPLHACSVWGMFEKSVKQYKLLLLRVSPGGMLQVGDSIFWVSLDRNFSVNLNNKLNLNYTLDRRNFFSLFIKKRWCVVNCIVVWHKFSFVFRPLTLKTTKLLSSIQKCCSIFL